MQKKDKMADPQKRLTKFPASSNVRVLEHDLPVPPPFTTLDSKPFEPRPRPPASLPLKVNLHSQQFTNTTRFKRRDKPFQHGYSPWKDFHKILVEEQDGKTVMAYKIDHRHQIVAIKEHKQFSKEPLKKLGSCAHDNVVELQRGFHEADSLFLVYEWMDLSLAELQSAPSGTFESFQIAAICKEVCP